MRLLIVTLFISLSSCLAFAGQKIGNGGGDPTDGYLARARVLAVQVLNELTEQIIATQKHLTNGQRSFLLTHKSELVDEILHSPITVDYDSQQPKCGLTFYKKRAAITLRPDRCPGFVNVEAALTLVVHENLHHIYFGPADAAVHEEIKLMAEAITDIFRKKYWLQTMFEIPIDFNLAMIYDGESPLHYVYDRVKNTNRVYLRMISNRTDAGTKRHGYYWIDLSKPKDGWKNKDNGPINDYDFEEAINQLNTPSVPRASVNIQFSLPNSLNVPEQKIFSWGGCHSFNICENIDGNGFIFNASQEFLRPVSSVNRPDNRVGHAAVLSNDKIVMWGGLIGSRSNGFQFASGFVVYNLKTDKWETLPNRGRWEPQARILPHMTMVGEKLFMWGGCQYNATVDDGFLNPYVCDVELCDGAIFDFEKQSWEYVAPPSVPVACFAEDSVVVGENIYLVPRENFAKSYMAFYNIKDKFWTMMSNPITKPFLNKKMFWIGNQIALVTSAETLLRGVLTYEKNEIWLYDPFAEESEKFWKRLQTDNLPILLYAQYVWTGQEIIVFGKPRDGVRMRGFAINPNK